MSTVSKARRLSKKKAQQKRLNKERAQLPPLFFDGYMRIPLNPHLDWLEVRVKTQYFGDWEKMRGRILGIPRWYRVTSHVFYYDGSKEVATAYYQHTGDNQTLAASAQKAFDGTREGRGDVDMTASYICVRA